MWYLYNTDKAANGESNKGGELITLPTAEEKNNPFYFDRADTLGLYASVTKQ